VDLMLDKTTLDEANRRVARIYRIPNLEHRKQNLPAGPHRAALK
jgi:hypothetical protein